MVRAAESRFRPNRSRRSKFAAGGRPRNVRQDFPKHSGESIECQVASQHLRLSRAHLPDCPAGTATQPAAEIPSLHPFEARNIHQDLPPKVRDLFDDGYYPEATFEAFKYLDKTVEKYSGITESGYKLMMTAFSETSPSCHLRR